MNKYNYLFLYVCVLKCINDILIDPLPHRGRDNVDKLILNIVNGNNCGPNGNDKRSNRKQSVVKMS